MTTCTCTCVVLKHYILIISPFNLFIDNATALFLCFSEQMASAGLVLSIHIHSIHIHAPCTQILFYQIDAITKGIEEIQTDVALHTDKHKEAKVFIICSTMQTIQMFDCDNYIAEIM